MIFLPADEVRITKTENGRFRTIRVDAIERTAEKYTVVVEDGKYKTISHSRVRNVKRGNVVLSPELLG